MKKFFNKFLASNKYLLRGDEKKADYNSCQNRQVVH